MTRARPWISLIGLLVAVVAVCAVATAPAAAYTCGSHYCSGSDSGSDANAQGNWPQIYVGEIGLYLSDFYGAGGPCPGFGEHDGGCFDPAAAAQATARWRAGTGVGVQDYYFTGGATAQAASEFPSPYCFGRAQGFEAAYGAYDYFGQYYNQQWLMAMDIEGYSSYGWSSAYPEENRQVVNGFYDFIAGRGSADPRCSYLHNGAERQQPAVYSSPDMWSYALGADGSIPNTYVWTYENCCSSTWPGDFYGGRQATFFGDSHYDWAWQFGQSPDNDVAYEPDYLPVFGYSVFK